MTPWISKPMMTVMVYMPSWPPICVRSSISTIFPAIRKRIPTGAYLKGESDGVYYWTQWKSEEHSHQTYHMMMATSCIMASFRLSKKSLRSWPCSFMLPIIRPKHMEKTTSPRALTPLTWPGIGITSSLVISMNSWVPLVELKNVSFIVTVKWTTLFPYLVLNWKTEELHLNIASL